MAINNKIISINRNLLLYIVINSKQNLIKTKERFYEKI